MGNPLYNEMNKGVQGGSMNIMQAFQQFMQQNQGKNPTEMIQQLLSSGQLNQSQLNQAQKMAKQIEGPLSGLRSKFGF